MSYDEQDVIEEQIHFSNIVATFEHYEQNSISANVRRRKDFFTLTAEDQRLLEDIGWKKKLKEVDKAIEANARFLRQIIAHPEIFEARGDFEGLGSEDGAENPDSFPGHAHSHDETLQRENPQTISHSHSHSYAGGSSHTHDHVAPPRRSRARYRPSEQDMDKLRSTIKQLVRDWAEEGKAERDACYLPMTNALLNHFAGVPPEERKFSGSGSWRWSGKTTLRCGETGLGCAHFGVGNEFSHHMLLTSYFMLNRTNRMHEHRIYPYIHSFSNTRTSRDLLRSVTIPDVLPSDLPEGVDFSLVAGDFEEIYGAGDDDPRDHESQVGQWNAVLTCFFMDTAKNVINYMRIIHRILGAGGVWINMGPLLWHFENNNTGDPSIELDLEEVKEIARKIGFEISDERAIETTYTSDSRSMLGYVYKAEFWIARKVSTG